jgi:quercetin dioxygenase-like cupin family protein
MNVKRWLDEQAPTEEAIRHGMNAEGLEPYRWSNAPGDVYGAHSHPYHKVIYVVEGSITFRLPKDGQQVTLNAGDRLDLPPGITHDAIVGSEGVTCLEARQMG